MQLRHLIALLLVTATLLLLIIGKFVASQILYAAAIIATFLAFLALLTPALPGHLRARMGSPSQLLVLWLLVAGVFVELVLEGVSRLAKDIGSTQGGLPYVSEVSTALLITTVLVLMVVSPSLAITAAERWFHQKWLWGAYVMATSFGCASVVMASGWQGLVVSPLTSIAYVAALGFSYGFFSFLIATWLSGLQLRDYSYLRFEITGSLPKIVSIVRRSDLFAHSYRPPSIKSEAPLKVTVRMRQESYVTHIYASARKAAIKLQIISFHMDIFRGSLYRDTRSDAICRDILAILSRELNCMPSLVVGPSSGPSALDPDFDSFALHETRERLSSIGRSISARRRALTKISLVLVGVLLIYFGWSNPKEPSATWLFGVALPVITFVWQIWDWKWGK